MDFTQTTIPQHDRYHQYNTSAKGRNRAKSHRDRKRLERPFLMWDGEGITTDDGSHLYTTLASSEGTKIRNDSGLGTGEIFDALIQSKIAYPDHINVVYGASYDFNMWLTSLLPEQLDRLYDYDSCFWQRYRITWRRGKSFVITDRIAKLTVTVYDVVSFFQTSFVKACDSYLGERFEERDMIVRMKEARGTFTTGDDADVERYNDAELRNGVALMNELRERLLAVDLRPSRWDGPGAIAAYLLKREGIKSAMAKVPDDVAEAARHGYAGGRFEIIKFGDVTGPAYEYDINSAYPHALRKLPDLTRGHWEWVPGAPVSGDIFGIYHVRWDARNTSGMFLPQPFFHRWRDGQISYPYATDTWVWAPEAYTALSHPYASEALEIVGGWVFIPESDRKPFGFIEAMYAERQKLKAAGNGAHVGLKLGLNSIYGKTCQHVGYKTLRDGTMVPPPFHQIEWAGWVTSYCRSMVLSAAYQNMGSIIAFETDALFSSEPLDLDMGKGLGQWEATEFQHLCYLQSGFYFGTLSDGTGVDKTRGVDRGSLTYTDVQTALAEPNAEDRYVNAELTRFNGLGLARLLNDMSRWQRWETTPKRLTLAPSGKREHIGCEQCTGSASFDIGVWHDTIVPPRFNNPSEPSYEYPLPWIPGYEPMERLFGMSTLHREDMAAEYE